MEEENVSTAANALDYKGFPADKSKTGGWIPAAFILGIEFCERLSTMGIAVNLVTYLIGTMHLPSATSANIVTDFMGTSFLLCLLGGFLADSFLGRYRTIAIFALVQTLGTGMLAMSTKLPQFRPPVCHAESPSLCKQATGSQMSILYVSLFLIAVGTGGLKSSVSGFGTDQFDENDEEEKAKMNLFFGRFFFFVSLGTLMAVTVLVYVQDKLSRSLGYGICSVSMFTAILIFLAGTGKYRYKKCAGSPVVHILQVLVAAVRKRHVQIPTNENLLYETAPDGLRIRRSGQFRFLDKAAVIMKEGHATNNINIPPNPWCISSVTKVEEVKMMIRLLPIWATTIIFWTTYAQMLTFSVEQASTLKRNVGSFQIPSGSLTVFFVSAILITLAVYDRLIIPLWKKWKGKPGFTYLQRMGLGLFLSALGMAVAALAEKKRLSMVTKLGRKTQTLPLSVFILIPQFILVGSGEAFIYTGQLDFFITQSPKGMKTMSTGIFLTTLAFGFFLSSLLVSIVKKVTTYGGRNGWVGDRIDNGRLDCFYGILAIMSFIDFGIYLVCAAWFRSHRGEKNLHTEMVANEDSPTEEKC